MKTIKLLIAVLFAAGLNNSYAQNTWEKKANFQGALRSHAVGFSIDGKGYIGTGIRESHVYRDFWEYDPGTDTWIQKADFGGTFRYGAVGFSIDSKGYIGTGKYRDTGKNDFWEYDPTANTWNQKADFEGGARGFAVGFSIGSKGYLGTGQDDAYVEKNDFWEYDPATNSWIQKADFSGGIRSSAVGFSIGSKGYIGTGVSAGPSFYKDFWEYDPAIDTWIQKAKFGGTARYGTVGFSIGSKGYIGTGHDGVYTKDFWEYDPASNAWAKKANFGPGTRAFAVGFSIGDKGYIGTGGIGFKLWAKDFWEYTLENTCLSPTGGMKVFLDLTSTSATLKWRVTSADVLHVRVRYRAVGGTTWTIKNKQGDKPSVRIDGLTLNTTYQWQLRSFCAEDTSGWVIGPNFTTAASLSLSAKATAYPNPAMNTVTVNYSAARNGKYIFEITRANGNVVLRKEVNAIPGANRIAIDISRFFKGIYFINIIKPDMTRERIQLNKE